MLIGFFKYNSNNFHFSNRKGRIFLTLDQGRSDDDDSDDSLLKS